MYKELRNIYSALRHIYESLIVITTKKSISFVLDEIRRMRLWKVATFELFKVHLFVNLMFTYHLHTCLHILLYLLYCNNYILFIYIWI